MRVVLQRVSEASVTVNGEVVGSIAKGLLILVGFEEADADNDIDWMVNKLCSLRVFDDNDGVMNLSITEVGGEFLVVSQFTLHAKTKKGNRPSYIKAARPEVAIPLYHQLIDKLRRQSQLTVNEGIFGAKMLVDLKNDGPVTLIIDTKNKD
ncbi:D-aminoacyl-tRNA deacylase [Perlabentimonas gracilis]|uniref:D-aminoacyl-tRNA deacylase n=1 Tax=Perlabentimonas gracilis TaxID=2715279 RepID=UPI00140CD296|nr:D-aminoacyl-tRNA deacylase [Perlabentimonas gracilis]NHB68027.1 D-tyrosyl-tRNA(Tyr) deacylase [Perlabentimonas gracilis]